jgi:hypothetical protein
MRRLETFFVVFDSIRFDSTQRWRMGPSCYKPNQQTSYKVEVAWTRLLNAFKAMVMMSQLMAAAVAARRPH